MYHVVLFPEFLGIYTCTSYLIGNNVTLQTFSWIFISVDICDKNNYHTTPIFTIIYEFSLSPSANVLLLIPDVYIALHVSQLLFSFLIFLSQNLSLKSEFTDQWTLVSVLGILGIIDSCWHTRLFYMEFCIRTQVLNHNLRYFSMFLFMQF